MLCWAVQGSALAPAWHCFGLFVPWGLPAVDSSVLGLGLWPRCLPLPEVCGCCSPAAGSHLAQMFPASNLSVTEVWETEPAVPSVTIGSGSLVQLSQS